jgi:carboxymethylenebutenolidase
MRSRHVILCIPLLLAACGGGDEVPAEEAGAEGAAPTAAPAEPRIGLAPLPDGEMPAVLTGQAPAPQGTALQYFDEDPAATGYLAVPDGEGPFPAVILIHEWNGVVDRIRQTADAFAREGYVALAADLYQGRTGSNPEENMALVRETQADPDLIIRNLNAAAAYLRARPDVTGKIGTMGWCFGGGVALSYAIGGDNHDATAIFYGRLVDDPALLAGVNHEIYGTFGQMDSGPSPEQVDAFASALEAAGVANDLHIYDDVGHGFWLYVDRDPENASAPALDAWDRLRAYLSRTLGDG